MGIKKQNIGLMGYLVAFVLVLSVASSEAIADSDSLESRLKAFNLPKATLNKASFKSSDKAKKPKKVKLSKSKRKTKVTKKRRYRRACYKSSAATLLERAEDYQPYIRNASHRYEVSEALIISVITAESCFARRARSPKNAQGLMQLIPATAERFGVKDAYLPAQNIKGGTRYLKFLLKRFSGNLHYTIAAYNAGEGAVDRYSGIPPYKETKEYVRRVMSVYNRLQNSMGGTVVSYSNDEETFVNGSSKTKDKSGRVTVMYQVANTSSPKQAQAACSDVSSSKLKKSSWLVKKNNAMKRYYSSKKPQSLSSIAKVTGVSLNLLSRMNRGISNKRVKPGTQVLVWQCANS